MYLGPHIARSQCCNSYIIDLRSRHRRLRSNSERMNHLQLGRKSNYKLCNHSAQKLSTSGNLGRTLNTSEFFRKGVWR